MALSRKRSLLAKLETTAGTAVTPGLEDRVTMSDYSPTPLEAPTVERQLFRPFVGAAPVLIGSKTAILNPTCEMVGGGLSATGDGAGKAPIRPQFHALLQACGMVEAAIKADGSAATDNAADHVGWRYTVGDPPQAKSCTIVSQADGIQQLVRGCRGTFVISGEIGDVPTIEFTMTGIYGRPLKKALPSGTAPTDVPPQLFSGDNTAWDGASQLRTVVPCVYSFSADCGHIVETVDCAARTTGAGLKVEITDRSTSGTVVADAKVETTNAATKVEDGDPWSVAGTGVGTAVAEAGTAATPTGLIRHGTQPGAWWTIGAASLSIGAITEGDRTGILTYNHPLTFSPSQGNDELTLTFWGKLD